MSFVKLFKVVVDSPIGFATVNQMADNSANIRTQMLVQHGGSENPFLNSPGALDFHALGRHDLDEVPRSVAVATLFAQSISTIGIDLSWKTPGISGVFKWGDGDYIVGVVGLSTWWAKVTPVGSGSVTYLEPRVRPFYATAANGYNAGIRVSTFALSAGDFVATDMSFSIALYGTP